ncbi:MAG TPA: 50S ribosomal protein L25 [Polyangiaceae bacterium]|jgi:large subunit ribosomal protein L25
MQSRTVIAARRTDHGKGAARRLRRTGKIPAIAYGPTLAPQSLEVSPKDLQDILASEHGRNTVLELEIEKQPKLTVLLSDFQYQPVTRQLLHADFKQISLEEPLDVDVPFDLIGKPVGVVMGGVLRQIMRKLPIRCLPAQIPARITHDITELQLNGHVRVKELTLPEGVQVRLDLARTLAAVVTEVAPPEEEAAPAAATAPGAAAPGEGEAAPAAEGAAPEAAPRERETRERQPRERERGKR